VSYSEFLHVPAGEGLAKWVSGDAYTMKVTKKHTAGTLAFIDGDRTFVAGAGDFIFIPRTRRHRFKNVTDTPAKTLFLFTPAGPEELFVEGGDDPRPGEQPVVWDMERVAQIADLVERTGLTVLPED
jgi:hypothetical protein